MNKAQILGQVGIIMMTAPIMGYGIYLGISYMISEYKYAKFRDKIDKTNHRTKHITYEILLALWLVIALILAMTGCILAELN